VHHQPLCQAPSTAHVAAHQCDGVVHQLHAHGAVCRHPTQPHQQHNTSEAVARHVCAHGAFLGARIRKYKRVFVVWCACATGSQPRHANRAEDRADDVLYTSGASTCAVVAAAAVCAAAHRGAWARAAAAPSAPSPRAAARRLLRVSMTCRNTRALAVGAAPLRATATALPVTVCWHGCCRAVMDFPVHCNQCWKPVTKVVFRTYVACGAAAVWMGDGAARC
jgi:hypothetical protein